MQGIHNPSTAAWEPQVPCTLCSLLLTVFKSHHCSVAADLNPCPLQCSETVAIYTALIAMLKTLLKAKLFQIHMGMMPHKVLVYNFIAKTSIYSMGSR